MRYASVLVAVLVATAALLSLPVQAGERYLVTPEEIGHRPAARALHLDSVPLQRGICG
jgi:hypothetical protein